MIAILYPLKMDKNLSEAYSSIYESSLTSGSGSGSGRNAMSDGGDGVHRSFSQTANMFNKNIPAAKNGKVDKPTRKAVNTSARDFGIQGPTTVKASHEPEGEMIDEKLSKEQQKKYDDHVKKMQDADKKKKKTGNPAFDDPSHHSFAKNKIKKNIFDEKEYNYVNSYLDELKKTTMGSYIKKASKDLADRRFDQGDSEKRKYDPDEADEKEDKKLDKREEGIARAAKKITKEGRYRAEWEEMKLSEINDHRAKFDEWTDSIVEEGYDIERWSDEELIDTFIDENGLWQSREGVLRALLSESDKKGKGSGKKDACYKKVKASAKVWPSAYASGRLVQCRKKGAANYGNKSEEMSDWRSEFIWEDEVKEGIVGGPVGVHIAKNHSYPARAAKLTVTNKGNKPAV